MSCICQNTSVAGRQPPGEEVGMVARFHPELMKGQKGGSQQKGGSGGPKGHSRNRRVGDGQDEGEWEDSEEKCGEVWEYYRDPELGAAGKGVKLLERLGWKEGRGLGHRGGRCGEDWGVRGRWVEEIRMVDKEEIIWQWSLTTGEGAQYTHQLAGLQFNQVIMAPIMANCGKSCGFWTF